MSVSAAAGPWPSVDVEYLPWAVARRPGPWPEPVHSGTLGVSRWEGSICIKLGYLCLKDRQFYRNKLSLSIA